MNTAIAIIAAYLIGSFPAAYIAGRLRKGIDIREVGSRNMGAMNVIYSVGIVTGILVLAVDIAKGAAAVFLARWLGTSLTVQLLVGATVVLGHAFPVSLRFRGGKGGASCIGILAFLMPQAIPIYIGALILLLIISRYLTFSYGMALISFPFSAWLVYHSGTLVIFSIALLLMLGIKYSPRILEMRSAAGSWRRVILRKGLKERF